MVESYCMIAYHMLLRLVFSHKTAIMDSSLGHSTTKIHWYQFCLRNMENSSLLICWLFVRCLSVILQVHCNFTVAQGCYSCHLNASQKNTFWDLPWEKVEFNFTSLAHSHILLMYPWLIRRRILQSRSIFCLFFCFWFAWGGLKLTLVPGWEIGSSQQESQLFIM